MVFGWTKDGGAAKASPAALLQNEEGMKVPIKRLTDALTDGNCVKFVSYYSSAHFEEGIKSYEFF
jgi:hypothetical protein